MNGPIGELETPSGGFDLADHGERFRGIGGADADATGEVIGHDDIAGFGGGKSPAAGGDIGFKAEIGTGIEIGTAAQIGISTVIAPTVNGGYNGILITGNDINGRTEGD